MPRQLFRSFPARPHGRPSTLIFGVVLACVLILACDQGPDDEAPQAVGEIPDVLLHEGGSTEVDVSTNFTDPEGGTLTFGAVSSNPGVAAVSVSGSIVTVSAVSAGTIRVVVTAMDPGGQSGQQDFEVAVPTSPVVELSAPETVGPENDRAVLPLVLSAPPALPITVTYTLGVDDDAGTHDADAEDFAGGTSGSVEIAAGATEAAIEVVFNDDEDIEPTREFFTIALDAPAAGAGYRVGARRRGTGTIAEGVCDRTLEVQQAIAAALFAPNCVAVQDEDLADIRFLVVSTFPGSEAWRPGMNLSPGFCDTDSPFSSGAIRTWSERCATDPAESTTDPDPQPRASTSALTTLKSGDFRNLDNLGALAILQTGLETLPADVFTGLTNLREMALFQNRITELPEGLFSGLESLQALLLTDNLIPELPQDMFSDLGGLVALFVDKNRLTEIPDGIGELEQLREFSANENRLNALPPQGPPGLQSLQLATNQLVEVPSGWLSEGLQQLHLQSNNINSVPVAAFTKLSSLTELILADNEIGDVAPGVFTGLDSLLTLGLDRNLISELPEGVFTGLPALQRLFLSGNPISELPPGAISGLPELELLALAEMQLAAVPPGIAELAGLKRLFLNDNRIAELPANLLAGLDSLELLAAPKNRIEALPTGFFVGPARLRALDLTENPGAPFPLNVILERADDDNALAPGPGTVAGRLPLGAPFNLKLPLTAYGGLLDAPELLLKAGRAFTDSVTVTPAPGAAGTQISAGPTPRVPLGFDGITLDAGDPVVLFGELANHPPYAVREIPSYRMRMGGDAQTLDPSLYFRDLDGDELDYAFEVSNPEVASVTRGASGTVIEPDQTGSTTVTVTATDPGGLGTSLSFSVLVRGFVPGTFDIDVILVDSIGPELQAAFENAAEWWMTILGDNELPDIPTGQIGQLGCSGVVSDQQVATIDDLVMVIATPVIDGPRGILAGAAPCGVREGSMLPFMGIIQFDLADLQWLLDGGHADDLEELIMHEMGHVLGIGIIWTDFGLLREPSLGGPPGADTHFAGPLAIAAFDAAGGRDYEGAKVPVENQAGPGSGDSHWRQSVFVTELMTPFASIGTTDPLSAITIQSLADLGYNVKVDLADPYTLSGAAAADRAGVELVPLGDDLIRGPVIVVDRDGRVVRVIGN
ncbi:MAG: leucine-rich repeat protein [Gemmatimonadetes bacterium]|nr:leucine-rich repeat protein [Gemmatimonadota bacterium]